MKNKRKYVKELDKKRKGKRKRGNIGPIWG